MSIRPAIAKGLCALALLLAAYGCGQDAVAPQAEPDHRLSEAAASSPTSTLTAAEHQESNSSLTDPPVSQLAATAPPPPIPTSTAAVSPIEPHMLPDLFSGGLGGGAASGGDVDAASVQEVLEQGLRLAGASPVHIAFRGTAAEDSVRCEWRGIARTPAQREEAIRFWLDLDEDDPLPSAAETERRFMAELDQTNAV